MITMSIDGILIVLFYAILLVPFMRLKAYNALFCSLIPVIFFVKSAIAYFIMENNIDVLINVSPYSMYDSNEYFKNAKILVNEAESRLFPELPPDTADILYLTALYWIGYVYNNLLLIKDIEFFHFSMLNVYISTINYLIIYNFLSAKKFISESLLQKMILFFGMFEPTMLAFSAVIEREIFAGLLLSLVFVYYTNKNWLLLMIAILLLVLTRFTFLFVFIAFGVGVILYKCLQNINVPFAKSSILLLSGIALSFWFAVLLENAFFQYIFRHNPEDSVGGFGGYISSLPVLLSVLTYSILGFISPIPFYNFFDDRLDGFYIFGLFQGLGAITFLALSLIILFNMYKSKNLMCKLSNSHIHYRTLNNIVHKIKHILIFLILCVVVFQGISFNIRHKVQLIPLLLLFAVFSFQYLTYDSKANPRVFTMILPLSFAVILTLNTVYFGAKYIVN